MLIQQIAQEYPSIQVVNRNTFYLFKNKVSQLAKYTASPKTDHIDKTRL